MSINIRIPTPSVSTLTLNGAKTYLVALGTVAFAGLSYWQHTMDLNTAIELALGAGGLGALRHGISTSTILIAERVAAQLVLAAEAAKVPAAKPVEPPPANG